MASVARDVALPAAVLDGLRRLGLTEDAESPRFTALTGGVASDIWRVDLRDGPVCVKRALARLRVEAEWQVPVERNLYEVRWFETAGDAVPEAVPRILGHDEAAGFFVMEYLEPADHRLWKDELLAGRADARIAALAGDRLARIHAANADRPDVAARFATDAIFYAIRLEAYFEASAGVHPDRAPALRALVETTAATHRTLVHGDVSPKNTQIGPDGPLFLDAECAWYGDPAFDVAFCANHLLLKCAWRPESTDGYLACFDALVGVYRDGVTWEAGAALEARAARLLPGLLLARVDGKSPVEYLTEAAAGRVRDVARAMLATSPDTFADVRAEWREAMAA